MNPKKNRMRRMRMNSSCSGATRVGNEVHFVTVIPYLTPCHPMSA